MAIAVALQSVPTGGVDIDEAAARALATVRQVMPSRLRHRIDGIRFTGAEAPSRVDPTVLEAASAAVRDWLVLRFDYRERRDVPRRLEPHAIVARKGRWYLIGWDLDKHDWRFFRLDRIRLRSTTGPRFTPRPFPPRTRSRSWPPARRGPRARIAGPASASCGSSFPPATSPRGSATASSRRSATTRR